MAIGTAIAGGDVEQMRQANEMGNMLMEPAVETKTEKARGHGHIHVVVHERH